MKILKQVRFFFICLVLCSIFSGCSDSGEKHSPSQRESMSAGSQEHQSDDQQADAIVFTAEMLNEADLEIVPVQKMLFQQLKTYPGTVLPRPDGDAHVGSLIAGRVIDMHVQIGDKVVKGSVLCCIESPEIGVAQAAFIRAAVQFDLAQQELIRYQKLRAEVIGSEKNLLEKEATMQLARAELNAADWSLRSLGFSQLEIDSLRHDFRSPGILKLKSPINGIVTDRRIKLGQRVDPEQDLFHILDLSRLWVQIALYESDLITVKPNQSANISWPALPELIFKGKVIQIGKEVNKETRTVDCYVEVTNNQQLLIPNLFVKCQLQAGSTNELALAVPEEAVVMDEHGDSAVYIEQEPAHFILRKVKTGRTSQGWIEIVDGLVVGERVVFKGAFFVKSQAAKGSYGHGHVH